MIFGQKCSEYDATVRMFTEIFSRMNLKIRKSKKAFIVGIGCNDLSSTSSQVAESVYQIYEYMMKNNYWMLNVGLF